MIAYEVYYPARKVYREKLPILEKGKLVPQGGYYENHPEKIVKRFLKEKKAIKYCLKNDGARYREIEIEE